MDLELVKRVQEKDLDLFQLKPEKQEEKPEVKKEKRELHMDPEPEKPDLEKDLDNQGRGCKACIDGYNLVNGKCEKKECLDGYKLVNGKCECEWETIHISAEDRQHDPWGKLKCMVSVVHWI